MDWDSQPNPFRFFEGAPRTPLEKQALVIVQAVILREGEGGTPEVLDEGGYFDLTPLDAGSDLRRDTVSAIVLERMVVEMAAAEGLTREQLYQRILTTEPSDPRRLTYSASGVIEGSLVDQFAMDEHQAERILELQRDFTRC